MRQQARCLIFGLLMSLVPVGSASAQQGRITGTVTDGSRQPLPNVTVRIPATGRGVLTDLDGRYLLVVPAGTYEVEASTIGYATVGQTVALAAGETATADFTLTPTALELGEVVVSVAAAESRRVELGTDIERFDAAEAVRQGAIGNFSELLNARATGVSISQSSGSVGAASAIRIRGSTSLTQDNNPIVYVDGIRVSNQTGTGPGSFDFGNGQTISRLDDINPQDIANIQVMKGPTAAALYGSEAAAGVILIETREGRAGEHSFTFVMEQGIANDVAEYPANFFNLTQNGGFTNIDDPKVQQWNPIRHPVTGDIFARHNPMENSNTSPLRTGRSSNYTLSLRGGSEAITYYGSLQYEDQAGTLPNNDLERYSLRANFTASPTDELDILMNTNFIGSNTRLPDNDRSAVGMLTNAGAGLPLFSRGTLPDGSPGDCLNTLITGGPQSLCDARQGNLTANFEKLATIRNEQHLGRFIGGITARWRPVEWFSNRLNTGIDYIQTQNLNLVPLDRDRPFGSNSLGVKNDTRVTTRILSLDYAGTASLDLTDRIASSTTVGAQYFSTRRELVGCSGQGGFASETAIACDAALTFSGFSDRVENIEVGALFQQQFGLDRYLFATGGVRVDYNSAFGENQGEIWSPSANVSALVSSMPFWSFDRSTISTLRLRAAWGTAAQAPAPFAHKRTFRPVRLTDPTGSQSTGISPLDPGNPDLTAERNEEWELGIDARFRDDRIGLKLTYYNQETTDAIVRARVPPSIGFSGAKFVNLGKIENQGVEALVDAELLNTENVVWEAGLTLSTQDPIVTSLGGQLPITFGLEVDHQMFREGFAPGAYFGEVVVEAERDTDGNIIPESIVYAPGNIDDSQFPNYRYLGNAEPSNEQSLSTTLLLFGRLRLFTLFDRAAGYVKLDESASFRTPFIPNASGSRRYAMRQAESTPEEQAMMELGGAAQNALFTEDASFIKWRELTVSYEVPEQFRTLLGSVDAARITVGGRNLYTWTGYGGLDPELRYDGGTDSFNADEFFTQPPPRSFFVRLSFSF